MFGRLFSRQSGDQSETAFQEAGEFKYCPSCGDEFRAEFQVCSGCDCELVSTPGVNSHLATAKDGGNSGKLTPIDPGEPGLVGVSQGSLLDLKRVKNLLGRHGVAALIEGEGPDCLKSCCGGSKSFVIKVRKPDLGTAGAVLSRDFIRSTDLASHEISTPDSAVFDERNSSTCPACRCQFIPEEPVCPECGLCF
jgi:hypothetical protein